MHRNFKVDTDKGNALKEALQYIREILPRIKMSLNEHNRVELMCEGSLMSLMKHSDFSLAEYISVSVQKSFGNVNIILSVPGKEFDFYGEFEDDTRGELPLYDESANILLPNLRYRHSGKFSEITIVAFRHPYSLLMKTLCALALAVISGILLRGSLPEIYLSALNDNVLGVIYEIFLDAMKMCTIPVVLLSLMLCTANIHGLSGLVMSAKRLGITFVFTQIFAVMAGFGLVMILGTGTGAKIAVTHAEGVVNAPEFSIIEMLKNIIPDNIITPIAHSNALQLTVLGCILGIAAGLTASKRVIEIAGELSNMFMKITELFMNFVPVAVFCSVSSLIITAGVNVLLSVFSIFLTAMCGFILLNGLYFVMIQTAGLNPVYMFRKSARAMITAFTTCSTSAAIPDSLNACKEMGISPKLYSFAIPVGAALNKNAFCLTLSVITLSAANMYGIQLSLLNLVSIGALIVLIAPGTSWTPVIALSLLFENIGCPLSAVGVIMGMYTLLDMADTVTSCNGTIASTLTTAKSFGLLNLEEYARS